MSVREIKRQRREGEISREGETVRVGELVSERLKDRQEKER